MTATEKFTGVIAAAIKKAQNDKVYFEEIYNNTELPVAKNEFLFFVKPEITLPSDSIQLEKILDLVQDKIEEFGLNIHNIKLLSAKYLKEHNIIAQHYGVINKIASNAVENLSEGAKEKFIEFYGKPISEFKVLGGIEFLEQYPMFNALSIDLVWQNVPTKKLAGGTYCAVLKLDNETVHLINGFHSRQLEHFTEHGRSIVVFTLSGNLSWADARGKFIGATNPSTATPGSLRRTFLELKDELGLAEISQGVNGVHLSAGPVEALIELSRYNSNFSDKTHSKNFTDYSFGKQLQANFTPAQVETILANGNVDVNGKATSIFDLTEEKDSDESIAILKKAL